jgi:hypothetical protein
VTLHLPLWLVLCALPFLWVGLLALRQDPTRRGGGSFFPAVSDRGVFLKLALPVALIASLAIAAVYWCGVAKGWWP